MSSVLVNSPNPSNSPSNPNSKPTQIKLDREYNISNETDKLFAVANDGTIAGRHPSISSLLKKAKSLDEEYTTPNKNTNLAKTKIKELVKHAQLTCDIVIDCQPDNYKYGHRFGISNILCTISQEIEELITRNREKLLNNDSSAIFSPEHHYAILQLDPLVNPSLNVFLKWVHSGELRLYDNNLKDFIILVYYLKVDCMMDELEQIAEQLQAVFAKPENEYLAELSTSKITIREGEILDEVKKLKRPRLLEKPRGHGSKHDIFHMGKINHQNQARNRDRFKPKSNNSSRDRSRSPVRDARKDIPVKKESLSSFSNPKNKLYPRSRHESHSSTNNPMNPYYRPPPVGPLHHPGIPPVYHHHQPQMPVHPFFPGMPAIHPPPVPAPQQVAPQPDSMNMYHQMMSQAQQLMQHASHMVNKDNSGNSQNNGNSRR